MCEANVYLLDREGEPEMLMESVDRVIPKEDSIYLEDIFGRRKTVKAKIREMQLVEHRIILEKCEASGQKEDG